MIGIRISVPIACWRKGGAREFWETEVIPPPATCYGSLLSLVGETDKKLHLGARITAGLLNTPHLNTILRTIWKIKYEKLPQGNGENKRPDLQQLWCKSELMIWCDSGEEKQENSDNRLEHRIVTAFENPKAISRFGGWSLGESTHLINDVWLIRDAAPPSTCRTFLLDANGSLTLPIWVDHVGMSGTKYAVGNLVEINSAPRLEQLPQIPLTS
jgi:CRISPR-associated protein Cas5t